MLQASRSKKAEEDTGQVWDLLDILLDISEDENIEMKLTTNSIKPNGLKQNSSTIQNIMKKAVEELDQVVRKNRLTQELDIPNLPYLQAIVRESLRLHPVVPSEDCTLSRYHIPANTVIFINVWEVGRDLTQWENPLEFMPGRFENQQLDVRGQHFHL
ncbi:cytochrome P450 93A3-like protein, partial [Tanacetum coccineum]